MLPNLRKGEWCKWHIDYMSLAPDEFVILSTLSFFFHDNFYLNKAVVKDLFKPITSHRSYVYKTTTHLKQYLRENKELKSMHLFMRKFDTTIIPEVIEVLNKYKVI